MVSCNELKLACTYRCSEIKILSLELWHPEAPYLFAGIYQPPGITENVTVIHIIRYCESGVQADVLYHTIVEIFVLNQIYLPILSFFN